MRDLFSKKVTAGDDVKPWLVAGPFYVDLVGILDERTYFENPVCTVGEEAAEEAMAGFSAVLRKVEAQEYQEVSYPYGQTGRWSFLSTEEIYHGFGQYFVTNHLGVITAYTCLQSETEQEVTLRLETRLKERFCLIVNGEIILNNKELCAEQQSQAAPAEATVRLRPGENRIALAVLRIARMAEVGWRLRMVRAESPVTAYTPLGAVSKEDRADLEESLQRTCLEKDTYREGETIYFRVGDSKTASVEVQLVDSEGRACAEEKTVGGRLQLSAGEKPGAYRILATWYQKETERAQREYSILVCKVLTANPGYEKLAERQKTFLTACAELDPYKNARDAADIVWARYLLGRYEEIEYGMIDLACQSVDRKDDCADFILLPLLRVVYEERKSRHLPEKYMERIRQAALGFKYWVDEANDCLMWFDSENHRFGFHTLEYLAGLLYPQDIFTNSGQNGLFHSLKGRMHLMEWLGQRLRFGFNEFHSDSYLPVTMGPMLAIQEMAPYEEFSLRTMARELTNIVVFHLAANSFNGAMASPRGRSYNLPMRDPMQQGTTSILYVLFGRDDAALKITPGAMAVAAGGYLPPEGICRVAYDYQEMENFYRSGLYHEGKQNADITAYRTPEYMVSSVRHHNVGTCEAHLHVAQVTLPKDTILFLSAPFTKQEGGGLRPDYWAGQADTPEVYQYRGTLCVCWDTVTNPFVWMTHCHFDRSRFDEVLHQDHWTFGRVGDSYVGIWSERPHTIASRGNYAGRELISEGRENAWIVECGSKREDGSFEHFARRLHKAEIHRKKEKLIFESPKHGRMAFSHAFSVEGKEVPIRNMAVESKYMRSRYGSGTYEYYFDGLDGIVWTYVSSV